MGLVNGPVGPRSVRGDAGRDRSSGPVLGGVDLLEHGAVR